MTAHSESQEKAMIELKPCPFCGGEAVHYKGGTLYPHKVKCTGCDALAGGTAYRNDEYNAAFWNTRAALSDTVHSDTRKLLMNIAVSCAFAHHDDALSPSDSEFIRTAAIRIRGIADKYRKALEAK